MHSPNAYSLILIVDFGIKIVWIIASLKAFSSISLRFDSTSIITFFNFEQDRKQNVPNDVTSFGMEIDEIDVDWKL